MYARELETQLEELLLRLVPELANQWKGASPDEIEQLQAVAGRPLPTFYRWFLTRMGTSVGPLEFRSLDLSAAKVLACYAAGLVKPHPRLFMIGFETDEIMPLHLFYDFDFSTSDDARIITRHAQGGPLHVQFDSLCEMLAWGKFNVFRIKKLPQNCYGSLRGESGRIVTVLDHMVRDLGFIKPVSLKGPNCAIYERDDAAFSVSATPRDPLSDLCFFRFGATDAGTIRRVLGAIADKAPLEIKIKEWTPPLPDPLGVP
jgi:hypothetical protein